jgi:glutathione synthase/RimK-type ligase-like ATP-grasp enzyme
MGRLAIYVERYTIGRAAEFEALVRYRAAAERLGHKVEFLFRHDLRKIPEFDAVFIRALTDPLNSAYVAARMAELQGLPVIDDPSSIVICCDKVNMYQRMMAAGVPIPKTVFVREAELSEATAGGVFEQLGCPIILKAPTSSFSAAVEKVSSAAEFVEVGRRFLRRAERIVAQNFMPSSFDWRVVTLAGRALAVCKYGIPEKSFKIIAMIDGKLTYKPVEAIPLRQADPRLIAVALKAAAAVGDGFYGVDLKQHGDVFTVIEVNDNPTVDAGAEDQYAPTLYEDVVRHLLEERKPRRASAAPG